MSMKDIFEANTDKVDLAVELLGELGDRTGKYVWKKYDVIPSHLTEQVYVEDFIVLRAMNGNLNNPINFTINYASSYIEDPQTGEVVLVNPTSITSNYSSHAEAMSALQGNYAFPLEAEETTSKTRGTGLLKIGNEADWTYSVPTSGYFRGVFSDQTQLVYSQPQAGAFLDYIVSSDSEAYPDGGEQDGFWYERVSEGAKQGILFNEVDAEGYPLDIDFIMEDAPASVNGVMRFAAGWIARCKTAQIFVKTIIGRGFEDVFTNFGGKLKLKTVERIDSVAFQKFGTSGTSAPKIWIPNSCVRISATGYTASPFYAANANTKIYCEAPSKPSDWGNYWNYRASSSTLTTTWGVTEEQFDAL